MESSDRIEKTITIRAPRDRVWRALTDHREFGEWFAAELSGPFETGKRIEARVKQPEWADLPFVMVIDRVISPRLFSFRWNPAPVDRAYDYSKEPMTLIEFALDEVPGGTKVTVVESGFDQIPEARRAEAFKMNSEGWSYQLKQLEQYVQKDR